MYETILVPTDGSKGAEAAARHGINLATTFGSQIHFLSVVNEGSHSNVLEDIGIDTGHHQEIFEHQATEAVKSLEELVDEPAVICHTAVEHGTPYKTIQSYVDEHDVDLISMGTHGRTGLDRVLLGSVTERVVRTSDIPVLACQRAPADRSAYDRILIPTDGSEAATAAASHAIAIAEQYDATIHAISVVDTNAFVGPYPMDPEDVLTALKTGCENAVEEIQERCEKRNIDAVTDVIQGTPHHTIQNYIDDEGVELVTMGTHGRTGLERYIIGSLTERVLRTSDVPVLTTRE